MPAQMLTAMFITNSKNGIKAEDVSLTANNNELNIKISITKQALEKLAKQQMQNLPVTASQIKTQAGTEIKTIIPEPAKPTAPEQPIKNDSKTGLDK